MDLPPIQIQQEGKTEHTAPCLFCKSPVLDEVNYGPMYESGDIVVHYFCMLFSAALHQKGKEDDEGILGFLPKDILTEVKRSSKLKCTFCGQKGASIGCGVKRCKYSYHFPCGLDNGVQYQFVDKFESFCEVHYTAQDIPSSEEPRNCPICREDITDDDEKVMSQCCKGGFFHKICIKKMALNAGYFFKCPMCNNGIEFIREMQFRGIFVPEQDASWEKEPEAFVEMLFEYSNCDADKCDCPDGRTFDDEKGPYVLTRCQICAAKGSHKKCGKIKTEQMANWACSSCLEVENNLEETAEQERPKPVYAPPSSSMSKTLEMDERVDFTEIKISKEAYAYFPYSREHLRAFQTGGFKVLPDYRGLNITINNVDWLGKHFRDKGLIIGNMVYGGPLPPSGARVIFDSSQALTAPADHPIPIKLIPLAFYNGNKGLNLTQDYIKAKIKTKKKRSSAWKKGVCPKRKKKSPIKRLIPLATVTSLEDSSEKEVVENTVEITDTDPPSKKRKISELGNNVEATSNIIENPIETNGSLKSDDLGIDIPMSISTQQQGNEPSTTDEGNEPVDTETGKENVSILDQVITIHDPRPS